MDSVLVAFGIAYSVFLLLLWLWLRTRAEDFSSFPDTSGIAPSPGHGGGSGAGFSGQGGQFGGGGASDSFDAVDNLDGGPGDAGGPVGEALGAAAQAEELAIPLVLLVLVGALLLSSLVVVYSAPVLLAELLVDGVLAASLYRRLLGLETRHWLETAVRRTFWPFLLTALISAGAGWAMTLYAPGSNSIGDVLSYARKEG